MRRLGSSPCLGSLQVLGHVLWLPARSAEGELLLRRPGALLRPSFLGGSESWGDDDH